MIYIVTNNQNGQVRKTDSKQKMIEWLLLATEDNNEVKVQPIVETKSNLVEEILHNMLLWHNRNPQEFLEYVLNQERIKLEQLSVPELVQGFLKSKS